MYENYFPNPRYTPASNGGLGQAFGYKENPIMKKDVSLSRDQQRKTTNKYSLIHKRLSIIKNDPDQFSVVYTPGYEYVHYKIVKFSLARNTIHRF